RAAGIARDGRDAGRRLEPHAVGAEVAHRPVLPVARERDHDDVGLDLAQRFVAEAEVLHDPRREALRHDVGGRDELAEDTDPLRLREVDHHLLLVDVADDEVGGTRPRLVLAVVVREDQAARDIEPVRRLEAQHIGAEVGEDARARGAGEDLREVDDLDAFERELAVRAHCAPPPRAGTASAPSTSAFAEPSAGGGASAGGVSLMRNGGPGSLTSPAGVRTVAKNPRSARCSSRNRSATLGTNANGIRNAWAVITISCTVCDERYGRISSSNSRQRSIRSPACLNTGFLSSSGSSSRSDIGEATSACSGEPKPAAPGIITR